MTTITIDRAVVEQALEALAPLHNAHFPCERELLTDEDVYAAQRAGVALRDALDAPQPEPVPVGWLDGPHGTLRRNPLWRLDPLTPQSVAWSIPLYAAPVAPPQREPLTPMDAFEDAIRRVGVVAACEWFGHAPDSEFTKGTFLVLAERARGEA